MNIDNGVFDKSILIGNCKAIDLDNDYVGGLLYISSPAIALTTAAAATIAWENVVLSNINDSTNLLGKLEIVNTSAYNILITKSGAVVAAIPPGGLIVIAFRNDNSSIPTFWQLLPNKGNKRVYHSEGTISVAAKNTNYLVNTIDLTGETATAAQITLKVSLRYSTNLVAYDTVTIINKPSTTWYIASQVSNGTPITLSSNRYFSGFAANNTNGSILGDFSGNDMLLYYRSGSNVAGVTGTYSYSLDMTILYA